MVILILQFYVLKKFPDTFQVIIRHPEKVNEENVHFELSN